MTLLNEHFLFEKKILGTMILNAKPYRMHAVPKSKDVLITYLNLTLVVEQHFYKVFNFMGLFSGTHLENEIKPDVFLNFYRY